MYHHRLSDVRDPVEAIAREPAHGVVESRAGNVDADGFREVVHKRSAVDVVDVVRDLPDVIVVDLGLVRAVVFVVNLAHDLLHAVLKRGDADDAAVFVDHDGHVSFSSEQLAHEFHNRHGFWHVIRRLLRQILNLNRGQQLLLELVLEQTHGVHDADDVIDAVRVHGHPGEPVRSPNLLELNQTRALLHAHDANQRGHNLPHRRLRHVQHVLYHLLLAAVDLPRLGSAGQHELKLLLRYKRLGGDLDVEHRKHRIHEIGAQPAYGVHQRGHGGDRADDHSRDVRRVLHGD